MISFIKVGLLTSECVCHCREIVGGTLVRILFTERFYRPLFLGSVFMDDLNFEIRTMARHELDIVVEWAAQEGWNPGKSDAESFYAVDPEGFLVGVFNGEVIASISVVKYDDTFGFLGFYIVRQDFRIKGMVIAYGKPVWDA